MYLIYTYRIIISLYLKGCPNNHVSTTDLSAIFRFPYSKTAGTTKRKPTAYAKVVVKNLKFCFC